MKKIVLTRIVLKDWKSLNLDVSFDKTRTIISGINGVGKSSLQSAWNWLLTSYTNAVAPKNHELFDNRIELSHETPTASVKAWISIDGVSYTIERTAQAKFTRKRGTNEWVKDSSDAYKTLIDEIEISTNSFTDWVEHNICPTDMLVYCLDGSFFSVLADDDKKKARKVLENIVGEIKAVDYKGNYDCMFNDFVKGYSIEQIEEKTKKSAKPFTDRMTAIPILIKDKEKQLCELNKEDYDALKKEIKDKETELTDVDRMIRGIDEPTRKEREALHDEIKSVKNELDKCVDEYEKAWKAKDDELRNKIDEIKRENSLRHSRNDAKEFRYNSSVSQLAKLKRDLASSEEYREVLIKRKNDIKALQFTGGKCPCCNQELPFDEIEKAKKRFNEQKKEDLDYIITQGKQTKAKIDSLKKEIEEIQPLVDKGCEKEPYLTIEETERVKIAHQNSRNNVKKTEEYKRLDDKLAELKNKLIDLAIKDDDELQIKYKAILSELDALKLHYNGIYQVERLNAEIGDLKCELRNVGNELAKHEMILDKCKEYIEERANIISERINGKLNDTAIQMWQVQKNGELAPSCTITDKHGVKYSTLNNSNRIKACIELQQMFCKHYDIELPVFVDEASVFSSNNQPNIKGQSIFLYASDSPTLVVECR